MTDLASARAALVTANHIVAAEGVVDAFGHVSIRHPEDPRRYIMSRSRSPALVADDDLMEFALDGAPVDQRDRVMYAERHIHGAIYEARPDVTAVIHNHSPAVIPFGVTGIKLRPLLHVAGAMGGDIRTWDIADAFGDATNLLVTDMVQGRDLARTHGASAVTLMRGHGCVVSAGTLKHAVLIAIYTQVNANLQMAAMQMGNPKFLSPREVEKCTEMVQSSLSTDRAWDFFAARVQGGSPT
jgi:HCOMODA/2-hydroxy-3-carboxy-muconic semialdehyde decarboxylase